MASVGERLRLERERQTKTIEDLAEATHIDRKYLEALERGDVEALPGRAFGKLYIRAYADLLGFEPQPLIDAYDLEQRGPSEPREEPAGPTRPVETAVARWRAARIAERAAARDGAHGAPPQDEPEPEPEPQPQPETVPGVVPEPLPEPSTDIPDASPPSTRRGSKRPTIAIGTVALLVLGAWLFLTPRSERVEPPVGARLPATPSPVPSPTAPPTSTPRPTREPQSHLRVSDFGVGRRVVHRRLEERTESFARGEVAWFQTQVQGGRAGESVRHVWLHDGRVVYSIELSLGGPSWRTQSRATLGRSGAWTLEARDEEGRVLARTTVRCE